ncbi:TRAP transporter substrate-binding protein [Franzmannia qiaohouensis]|uniref:TRAP transporter substrate-binding protein n=1 Tax=Franzmannia qiaohouensis TaxID=1329370 RepID=A0ABU1HCY1_9GAMM|nr:TRAP transporter substrate-binding protein [Halomonas qiaohouensis]MDR5905326.1 TRAP transporter substrate-binding protein [Halomonas qiaohouensis]
MTLTARRIPLAASLTLAAGLAALPALAEATTLRIAHVWPGGSMVDRELFGAWAESVEEASEGRLSVEIYPGQTLASADNTYQGAVSGIADIGATAQGYSAGRFPLTQVIELPGVSLSSRQGSCILQSLYDDGHLDDEYDDSHVLFMFTTGPGYLHTSDRLIETPSDLEGLRMRRPTAVVGDMFSRLGAQAIGMPAPDVFTSMQRGAIDGLSFNWEGMKTFRLNEQAHYHTEVPLYDLALTATMNRDTYESLPDDLRQIIDEHSGMQWSLRAAAVYDELIRQGREEAQEAGHEFLVIDDAMNDDAWGPVLQETIDRYLADTGGDAESLYEESLRLQQESCDV